MTIIGKMPKLPPDAQVWRYVSLATFIDILQRRKLFFPRLSNLLADDHYEGSVPKAVCNYLNKSLFRTPPPDELVEKLERDAQTACVSCWHINNGESAAMWKLYAHKSGVAMRSSFDKLNRGFRYKGLKMGCVDYADFHDVSDLPSLQRHPEFLKRRSFSYEQELRLVIYEPDRSKYEHGKYVPILFDKLVDQVYVSPAELPWVARVVRRELEKYAIAKTVIHSELYSETLK